MSSRNTTRAAILRVGTELIGLNGFNNTGLDAVLKAAAVPKGSFYHYFASKEDFGLAVIDEFAASYEARLDHYLHATVGTPLARLKGLFVDGVERHALHQCSNGCLIGTLGQEMASQDERFRLRLDAIFKRWEARFAVILAAAKAEGELGLSADPDQLARALLASWEGAILRAKVTRSRAPFDDFLAVYFDRVLH